MSNLTRYSIEPAIISNEAVGIVRVSASGDWVKFDDIKELLNTDAQQLKPKIPLLEEVLNSIGDKGSNITCQWNFNAGVRECYEYISRHFGR
jgi:hypothetical protein